MGHYTQPSDKPINCKRFTPYYYYYYYYYYYGNLPTETEETHEDIRGRRCPDRESNPVPSEYKSTL
jgi:hypothetical protein